MIFTIILYINSVGVNEIPAALRAYGNLKPKKKTPKRSLRRYFMSWADYSPLKGRRAVILARLIALARILW